MISFRCIDEHSHTSYVQMLSAIAKLSGLFSDSSIPYINYRVAENLFCRSFSAINLSRSDTAFDAKIGTLGIGLKTFICEKQSSLEKVAEFNALSTELKGVDGLELAMRLGQYRNERIELANRLYNIDKGCYHIVARADHELILFETDYDPINVENITPIQTNSKGVKFTDGKNYYTFNSSKSTLFRRFVIPETATRVPVEILENPYDLLLYLSEYSFQDTKTESALVRGEDYVILPLYSTRSKIKEVPEKSGLNQWNAGGRKRDMGEVYIPIPIQIHKKYPNFFPDRDQPFSLKVPTGEIFSAKVCQESGKALMTNPNRSLSDWLLRRVFNLAEGELLTYERMKLLGFDSVVVYKGADGQYSIDKAISDSYDMFIGEEGGYPNL